MLKKESSDLQNQFNKILKWKEAHNCFNDINIVDIRKDIIKEININDFSEHKQLEEKNILLDSENKEF